MKRFHTVSSIICSLVLSVASFAGPKPIDSMNITGGFLEWSLPGGPIEVIPFTIIGTNTNLVGGYIGVGASTSAPFDPPDLDNILIFPVLGGPIEQNFGLTYTAASNLGASSTPTGTIPGGPVPYGTLDDTLNTIEMNLSSWFGNLNNVSDIWAGTGANDGYTSPTATGTWDSTTFEYILSWNSMSLEPPFPGLTSTWVLTGFAYPTTVVIVAIDIKPGSDPNCFNIYNNGVIPVAILGEESLDVGDIDASSLSFAGLEVRIKGNAQPSCGFEYINTDEFLDMVCQFKVDATNWSTEDGSAMLIGQLLDGTPIEGTDSICLVP